MKNQISKLYCIFVLLLLSTAQVDAQKVAFPGAEGFGRYVAGGRGGAVYYVTNLNDSGTGSLRWAIGQTGTRTIVFKVSGTIELQSNLSIKNGDVTIAGQTAPGDGICLKNYPLLVDADNIIIRFIRARLGDAMAVENDAFGGRYRKNIIVDHCSFSWSTDETVSLYSCHNTTIQWCIISESLKNSVHVKAAHGYGAIVGGNKASYHHNLLAHHDSRSPRIGPGLQTQTSEYVDMRNNVLYNYAGEGCYGAEAMNVNIVNNLYKPGPASNSGTKRGRIIAIDKKINLTSADGFYPINNIFGKFYISGNVVDGSASSGSDVTVCTNATNDNWTYGVYNQINSKYNITSTEKQNLKVNTPFDSGVIETEDVRTAYDKVLKWAGCSYQRDAVDTRIVNEVKNGTYTYKGSVSGQKGIIDRPSDVGGYPTLNSKPAPIDTDGDGMPDAWEAANNLNSNNASDRNNYTLNANYTNLEVYLNSLVEHIIGGSVIVPPKPINYIYSIGSTSTSDWGITSNWTPTGTPSAIDTAIIRTGEVKVSTDIAPVVKVEPDGLFRIVATSVSVLDLRLQGGTLKSYTSTPLFSLTSTITVEQNSTIWAGSQTTSVFQIDGEIKGTGDLTKTYTGVLSLHADASTYTGNWNITEGTLRIANNKAVGENAVFIATGASFDIATANVYIDKVLLGGTLNLNNDMTAREFSIGGKSLPVGTYTATDYPMSIFGNGTLTVLECTNCEVTQTIELTEGWNLISINVVPSPNMVDGRDKACLVSTVFNGLNVQTIKTMSSFWRKDQPEYLNSLQTITSGEGYLVKINTAGTLSITGTPISFSNFQIPIFSNWILIGSPSCEDAWPCVSTPFSDYFNSTNCELIKNFDGFWIPNGTTNSMQVFEVGKGYFIKK